MRGHFRLSAGLIALLAAPVPVAATLPSDETRIENMANNLLKALSGEGNYTLAELMLPDGVMMEVDQRDPENPKVTSQTNAQYLAKHQANETDVSERMEYDVIIASDGVGQVWGPYRFMVDGKTMHCGIKSLSFVEINEDLWRLGNSSYTVLPPEACANLGAPAEPAQ